MAQFKGMSQAYLSQILVKIAALEKQNKRGLLVFDLDSTLFDVSPRVEKILIEFAKDESKARKYPEHCRLLANIRTSRSDWGFQDALVRAGLDGHHPEFQKDLRDFWYERFFSDSYLQYDLPYEGAVEFVQALYKFSNTKIAYLTGRDQHRMGVGSPEILEKWNFPLRPSERAELVLKPHKSLDDAEFKKDWFLQPEAQGFDHVWFFENEPVNVHLVRKECPHVEVVFFESTHSGKAEPPIDIPRIFNFLVNHQE